MRVLVRLSHLFVNCLLCVCVQGCLIYELAALSPPFKAQNHLALATKIRAGLFERIPARYSEELSRLIRSMIQVDQNRRPSVETILRHPRIAGRIAAERERDEARKRMMSAQAAAQAASAAAVAAAAAGSPTNASLAPCAACASTAASLAHAQRALREDAAALAKRSEDVARREAAVADRERKARDRETLLDKREMQQLKSQAAGGAPNSLLYRNPLQQLNLNNGPYTALGER
jgi:NIMA (never in mitosis gene a)-related kinase